MWHSTIQSSVPPSLLHGRLSDQRILFLGDSTLRYLYLTLVNAGALAGPSAASGWATCTRLCFWNEQTWPSWHEYYQGTSLANGSHCDCYRSQPSGAYNPQSIIENRYNQVGGAHFDYLQLLDVAEPLQGTWWPGDGDELRAVHRAFAPRWALQLEIACRTVIAALRPTAIVVNIGHHLARGRTLLASRDESSLRRVYERLATSLSAVTPNVLWVTSIANHGLHARGLQLEHRLVREYFPQVINTSEWLAGLRGTGHFWDGNIHLQIHNNLALACGLMRRLHRALIQTTGARHVCPS